ncbi:unnamed protein product [Echinostoma caproni]|uniref:Uncharacterized protein n=1 Tax=Echinostoma caproni TaxID=27848 RepID=A0A3P8G566_9TREM|nr:unnamed protein product [Echinostoma caproni]
MAIGTHNGCFHCDEVFAVYLLRQLPEFKDSVIIRSRDPKELNACDAVVDVGGVYDPEQMRFDHHQNDFFDTGKWSVKLSSAGLVYVHYGKKVLSLMTNLKEDSIGLHRIFMKVYESFVLEIDGTDNGVSQSQNSLKYHIHTDLDEYIQWLFYKALELVGREFVDTVEYFSHCWWPAREIVSRAMKGRRLVDESRAIIVLEQSCPWMAHLFDLEREERAETPKYPPKIFFVVLPGENGNWVVQSHTVDPNSSFKPLPFPDSWHALRDDELCAVTGLDGCIFVHTSGHLGVNKTRQGAIEMAQLVVHDWKAKDESEAGNLERERDRVTYPRAPFVQLFCSVLLFFFYFEF